MSDKKLQDRLKECRKKKSNKKCFDCGLAGPHSNVVLSPYNIFVCQSCAGLHRSLNHKVKGISMSNFSSDEVDEIETGGNRKAKAVWLSAFDPEAFPFTPSDTSKIKEKMRLCYEEKRWTGRKLKKQGSTRGKKGSTRNLSSQLEDEDVLNMSAGSNSKSASKVQAKAADDILDLFGFGGAGVPIALPTPSLVHHVSENSGTGNPFDDDESDDDYNPFASAPASAQATPMDPQGNSIEAAVQEFVHAVQAIQSRFNISTQEMQTVITNGLSQLNMPVASSSVPPHQVGHRVSGSEIFADAIRHTSVRQMPLTDMDPGHGSNPFDMSSAGEDEDPFGSAAQSYGQQQSLPPQAAFQQGGFSTQYAQPSPPNHFGQSGYAPQPQGMGYGQQPQAAYPLQQPPHPQQNDEMFSDLMPSF